MTFHGANLIPEGLETGEYVIKQYHTIDYLDVYYVIAYLGDYIYTDNQADQIFVGQAGYKYNGIFSSVTYIIANESGFKYLMSQMKNETNSANILTIFTIPKLAFNGIDYPESYSSSSKTWDSKGFQVLDFDQDSVSFTVRSLPSLDGLTSLENNYVPRNKKLLTHPYIYLACNPTVGSGNIYRYEDFNENHPVFDLISEINPNPQVLCIPMGYRHAGKTYGTNLQDLSSISGYPSISYRNDNFNVWLAENSNMLNINLAKENLNYQQTTTNNILNTLENSFNTAKRVASTLKNGDRTNALLDLINGLSDSQSAGINQGFNEANHHLNIKSQLAQIERQKMLPDSAVLSGNNSTLLGYNLINSQIFTTYCIKEEFARKLDRYFDMYGYLTNNVKIPNLNNRPNWNYVKTIRCNNSRKYPSNGYTNFKKYV